jgi:hypothetical protein
MYAAGYAQEFLRGHVDKLDLQIKRARDKLANDQSGRLTLSKETQAQAQKTKFKSTQYSDFYIASVPGHPQQVDPGSGTRKKSQSTQYSDFLTPPPQGDPGLGKNLQCTLYSD